MDVPVSASPVARHLLPMNAVVEQDGMLSVGGVRIDELARIFGTPLFVYDEEHLRTRCREAMSAWGQGVAYASKAFMCKAMARLAYEEGLRIDVASGGEMHVAVSTGVPPSRLILHGNNKSEQELIKAFEYGVGSIVVDSFDELRRIAKIAPQFGEGNKQALMLRINPGVEAHTHEFIKTGQTDSKFGLSVFSGDAMDAVRVIEDIEGVFLSGIHSHIGSQVFNVHHFEEQIKIMVDFTTEIMALPGMEDCDEFELCIGGGLGVAYLSNEKAPGITEWAETVRAAMMLDGVSGGGNDPSGDVSLKGGEVADQDVSGDDPSGDDGSSRENIGFSRGHSRLRITAEPGRAIVATAGMTVYSVGTVKDIRGVRTYISVDGGMSDNPRPVLYGSGYEAFIAREVDAERNKVARVVGKHCESGDVLISDAQLPQDISVGDLLVVPVTGAYGYSMASNYNKVPRPPVVFVSSGNARLVVRGESLDDMCRLDVS